MRRCSESARPTIPLPKIVSGPATPESLSFEAALKELESIVDAMEGDGLALEDSLSAYRRGADLIRVAQARLAAAEQQVKVLEDGVLKPLDLEGGD
jgi:exodeoxyribonuclease VII small subunit